MHTKLPEGSVVYVFGSFLRMNTASDLDVLVVYDSDVCLPEKAYELHKDFLSDVFLEFGLPVHATLLSVQEERDRDFIQDTGAIPFLALVNSK
jgi:predicted nucleotidyltransferase